ncbi:hypothetical protein [Flavobacterium sp.]|uniref:hypothetical protein n=1 Tax=Flavobacterium sp. TaxID=239 RepID=UPI003F695EBF
MKKIAYLLLFVSTTMFSQKLTKDQLLVKLSEATCDCSQDKEFTKENYEMTLGLCLFEAVGKYEKDVEKHYGKDYMSKIEDIGGDVGEKIAFNCPKLLQVIMDNALEDDSEMTEDEDEMLEGTYTSTNVDGFLFVNMKENSGKTHQLLLINSFDNAYLITDKVLKANDKIEVYYFEAELYNAKTAKYENFKVITDIERL